MARSGVHCGQRYRPRRICERLEESERAAELLMDKGYLKPGTMKPLDEAVVLIPNKK